MEPTKQTAPLAQDPPLKELWSNLRSREKDFTVDYDSFAADMADEENLRQLHTSLAERHKDFKVPFDEFATDMGLKKKALVVPGGATSGSSASAALPATTLTPSTPATGRATAPTSDQEFVAVAPDTTQPQPDVAMDAEAAGLEVDEPFTPGTSDAPLAQNIDSLATGAVSEPRAPAKEENDYLSTLPAFEENGLRADGSEYDRTPYGKELVAIPNDYTGAVPPGSFQLHINGKPDLTQYFYRDLKKTVDGKEQSYGDAIQGKIKNALYSMGQGIAEGGQAFTNASMMATNPVGFAAGGGTDAGDKASEAIEGSKTKIAPYYNQGLKHTNWESAGLFAADYAPLVIAQVAQTLAPELRAPAALQKALGFATAAGFDADMYHAAHEHAKQIFPNDPRRADLYTLFEGTLTVAGFKAGSKLMTELGDKLAFKASPFSLKRTVARDAVERLAALEQKLGRVATNAEYQQVLHDSLRAALPKLVQLPKEAFQQAGTFAGVEGVKTVGNQLAAPALGGQADDLGPDPGLGLLANMAEGAKAGATMGLVTAGVGAALPTTELMPGRAEEVAPEALESTEGEVSLQPELTEPTNESIEQTTAVPETQPVVGTAPGEPNAPAPVEGAPAEILNGGDTGNNQALELPVAGEPVAAQQSPELTSNAGLGAEQPTSEVVGEGIGQAPPAESPAVLARESAAEGLGGEQVGAAERKTVASIDEDATISDRLKTAMRDTGLDKYEPKSVAETEKEVDSYLGRVSLEEATTKAIAGTNLQGAVRTALRVKVMEKLDQAATAAEASGDSALAEQHAGDALAVAESLAKTLTDAGQEVNAAKLINRYAPAAVEHLAKAEVAKQRVKAEAKLEKKALPKERKRIAAEKKEAVEKAIKSPRARAVRDSIVPRRRPTSQAKIDNIRGERSKLFEELKQAGKKKSGTAFVSLVPITPQQAQQAGIYVKIFRTYIQEGVVHVNDLVARFRADGGDDAKDIPASELAKNASTALRQHRFDDRINQAAGGAKKLLGETLDQIARDYTEDRSNAGATLAERFVEETGIDPKQAKRYADAIEAEFNARIDKARQRRLNELERRATATPTKRVVQTDLQKTRELFTLSPTDDASILDHLKRVNDLPDLSVADVANLRQLARVVQKAPEGFQKDAAVGELMKAQARIKGVNKLELAGSLWYASILSALKTHGINIFANTAQLGVESTVSTTHRLLRGQGRYALNGYQGLGKGLARGAREAASVLTTGREVATTPGKYDIPGSLEWVELAGGKYNPYTYLKYVPRALRAMDVLFSTGLKEMRAYELATAEALADQKSGVPTPDVWAAVAEKLYNSRARIADAEAQAKGEGLSGNDYRRRVFEIAEQSRPAELVNESREYGTRAVFNGTPEGLAATIAHGVQQIAENVSIGGVKPVKVIVPFTRVISNVANAVMDYTPIGAARAANSLVRAKYNGTDLGGAHLTAKEDSPRQRQINGEERERLLVKATLGAGVMAALYALSHDKDEEGNPTLEITGNGTGDVQKDAQLKASEGWMPQSIKYQGRYYSFANTPLALAMGFVGNVNDGEKYRKEFLHNDDAALDNVSKAAFQTMVSIGDITAVRGPRDFLQATRTPDAFQAYLKRMAASTAASAFPLSNLAQETFGRFYDHRKEAHTLGEAMQRNIPGARNGLNDAIDVLGDPLPAVNPRLWNKLETRDEATESLWAALRKQGLFLSVPSKQMGGTLVVRPEAGNESPMTDDEFYRFMAVRGKLLKAALLAQVDGLKNGSKPEAEAILHNATQMATQQAKLDVFGGGGLTTIDRLQRQRAATPEADD